MMCYTSPMLNTIALRLLTLLKEPMITFGEKLRLTSQVMPQLDAVALVQALRTLIEVALESHVSYNDLNALCEASEESEMLHDYLRAFFQQDGADPRRVEMAQRLDGIIGFRMAQNKTRTQDRRLRNTLCEYLLRAKN